MADREAEKWQLRAEEYRTIGGDLSLASTRDAYQAMAEHCDWMASQVAAIRPTRRLSSTDCLSYAQQCDALAPRLESADARARVRDVAAQWRKLAHWAEPAK
jgi:hypothetical protein